MRPSLAKNSQALSLSGANQPSQPYTYFLTGVGASAESGSSKSYRRGDAKANGVVDMADALFIAHYVAGTRGLGNTLSLVHPVNSASVKPDDPADKITVADYKYIAQRAVGLWDNCFDLIGGQGFGPGLGLGPGEGTQTGNATVEIGSITLAPGQTGQVPVWVKGINDPDGLGGYDFKVLYNPAVINVLSLSGGTAPFDGAPTYGINNTIGQVLFNSAQSAVGGPTGDILLAYLTVQAVGQSGSSSTLDISVTSLIDGYDADDIPAVDSDGLVTVQ